MSIAFIPFTPTSIPGCLLWADASDRASVYQSTNLTSTVVSDGQFVGSWLDKSGNNRSFTQTTASYRPFFSSSGIFFSTSAAHLLFGSLPNSANQEVYSVVRPLNNATTRTLYTVAQRDEKPLFLDSGNNAGFFTRLLFANYGYGFQILPTTRTSVAVSLQYQSGFLSWFPIAERNSSNFNGTQGNIYADRSLNSLGNNWSNLAEPWGEVNEIAVYNRFLSSNERYALEAYYANKWGFSANLSPLNTQLSRFTNPTINTIRMGNTLPVTTISSFLGTGAVQTFTVPAGITTIRFFMWGAGGQAQNGTPDPIAGSLVNAGSGAYVEGNLFTTPGTTYQIIVGQSGVAGLANGAPGIGANTISGGGFSGIFSGSPAAGTVIAIAGGGGGSGYNAGGNGGGGGYASGLAGTNSGGQGGTQSAGGAASVSGGTAGSQLQGGNGVSGDNGGGGGGGGWYGGGGGNGQRGAGGGSSTYTSSVVSPVTVNGFVGVNTGTTTPTPAANESSPYWISPYGRTGRSGLVIIGYNTNAIPSRSIVYKGYTGPFRTTSSFYGTGTVQSFTVPAGITMVRFFCWGSGGIGQNGSTVSSIPGSGAYMAASIITIPGQIFYIVVGVAGQIGIANGGGSTGGTGAGGGGFSGVFLATSPTATNVVLIAGAGGGAGFNGGGVGGGGGYPNGSAGTGSQSQGGGGTQTSGGTSSATAGSSLAGGNGGNGDNGGGGGGGGWYGGGGGLNQGAGGGGSGYVSALAKAFESFNGNNGGTNGASPALAGNESSPYWQTPYGRAGQNGLVVVAY